MFLGMLLLLAKLEAGFTFAIKKLNPTKKVQERK